jgi:DNA-binding transcriptional ArsR family regulator
MVTYSWCDDDRFKALADPSRRLLLDLFERDGRAQRLESQLEMTRFGVMKHLRQLEDAGLVVTRKVGREKFHYLNPVPIQVIHDRWIDKYRERRVSALADLKTQLEDCRGTIEAQARPLRSGSSSGTPRRLGTPSRSRVAEKTSRLTVESTSSPALTHLVPDHPRSGVTTPSRIRPSPKARPHLVELYNWSSYRAEAVSGGEP